VFSFFVKVLIDQNTYLPKQQHFKTIENQSHVTHIFDLNPGPQGYENFKENQGLDL
jgi:hypothetical protein